jgi:hypothetical protein
VPVRDSALRQVIRRQFQRYPITIHDLDPIPAKFPGHRRQHCATGFELNRKHPSLELLDDLPKYFDCVFFWQMFLNLSYPI